MSRKVIKIKKSIDEIYVYWVLTDFCNQKCSYCHPELHNATYSSGKLPGHPSDEEILNFVDRLIETSKELNKPLKINISGGEPTTHSAFSSVLEKFRNVGYSVEVTTNGSYNVQYWKKLPVLPTMVIISLHPQYYDKRRIRINELLDFLTESNVSVMMNLMCLPEKWDVVQNIVSDIADQYKKLIVPKVIWDVNQSRSTLNYTPEQLKFITGYSSSIKVDDSYQSTVYYDDGYTEKLIPNKFVSEKLHLFNGWKCSAGMESISIHPDGTIRAGICRAMIVSTIKNFKLNTDYITCPLKACTCPGDLLINKYNPNIIQSDI